jgi:hypothetical protein
MGLLVPRPLLGRLSDEDHILLSASHNEGAGMVEGSGIQSEEDWGIRCMRETLEKGMKRHEAQRVRRKQLMYCIIISHGFISITDIGVLYSFPWSSVTVTSDSASANCSISMPATLAETTRLSNSQHSQSPS